LVSQNFRIVAMPSYRYPYEVVTLSDLEGPERVPLALAHLVIYERAGRRGSEQLYRICLQDDRILQRMQAMGRPEDEHQFAALITYILTHELVHVVRFQRDEHSFLAQEPERQQEEETVHQITCRLLQQSGDSASANIFATNPPIDSLLHLPFPC
jgi:hypothetical protein